MTLGAVTCPSSSRQVSFSDSSKEHIPPSLHSAAVILLLNPGCESVESYPHIEHSGVHIHGSGSCLRLGQHQEPPALPSSLRAERYPISYHYLNLGCGTAIYSNETLCLLSSLPTPPLVAKLARVDSMRSAKLRRLHTAALLLLD